MRAPCAVQTRWSSGKKEYVQAARVIGVALAAHHVASCAAQRDGAGDGAGDLAGGHRHPDRGDACPSSALGVPPTIAVARHADPQSAMTSCSPASGGSPPVPRRDAGADRAQRQPAGRLAARCVESTAGVDMQPLARSRASCASSSPRATAALLRAGLTCPFRHRAGRGAGHRRRIGCGQVVDRRGHHRPAATTPGRIAAGGRIKSTTGSRIDNLPDDADAPPARPARSAAIFQDPMTALNPLLHDRPASSIETITHPPGPLTEAEARGSRGRACWKSTGISGARAQRLNQYPHQFSGGMRQRVVTALALAAHRPCSSSPTSPPPRSTSPSRRRSSRC